MDMDKVAIVSGVGVVLLICAVLVCRIWKRNRYYKKVQHSLDEEERAFQETLERSYCEDTQLNGPDQEKLQILEIYLASARADDRELKAAVDAMMPSCAEDVDSFMAELAAAAGGDGPAASASAESARES